MFILFLFIGAVFIAASFAFIQNESENNWLASLVIGVCFFTMSSVLGFFSGYDEGRIRGLTDSGKYEIVSNADYSLNELKTFIKIGDFYLKEVEESAE